PVQELAAGHAAAADAGSDRDVAERVEAAGGAPRVLAQRGRVHVRVEGDRDAEPTADLLADVRVRPARLRRRRDVTPRRRARVRVQRAEGSDPDRVHGPGTLEE